MRVYQSETGARIVVHNRAHIRLIPAWCPHIAMQMTRAHAARMLRDSRAQGVKITRK